jgi:uncharacterized protein (DUF697 family)
MANSFVNIWKTVGEVDLRPIREDALREVRIALVGESGSGRHTLADRMRRDLSRPEAATHSPVQILGLEEAGEAKSAHLVILMIAAGDPDVSRQRTLAHELSSAGKKVVVFYNLLPGQAEPALDTGWEAQRVFIGPADDEAYLAKRFVPAILELLPNSLVPLGRNFPLFRVAIARDLINETSLSNAAFAFSTSLAELVPVLNIPFTITDMVVITKAQAFLVYRLGLTLGYSTRWQDYVREFGGVIGSGFLWRQLARYLFGLLPVIGIIPKVVVAYTGTFVIGQVVLRWYLTGRHVSKAQFRELYRQATLQGRAVAYGMVEKVFRRRRRALPAEGSQPKPRRLPAPRGKRTCPNCGKKNSAKALFCQYCGQPLTQPPGPA